MPVLRRAHDRRRDLRARRWPARPAITRTRDQDRGRMTPNNASPQRKPAGGRRRRRQPNSTLVRSIRRPGPPIAPTSTGLGARDRTPAPRLSRSLRQPSARAPPSTRSPVPPPAVGNHQIPIDPKAEPGLRGFLPWRLSDAGPRRCPLPPDRPASETLHRSGRFVCAPNHRRLARAAVMYQAGRGLKAKRSMCASARRSADRIINHPCEARPDRRRPTGAQQPGSGCTARGQPTNRSATVTNSSSVGNFSRPARPSVAPSMLTQRTIPSRSTRNWPTSWAP